jgi:hypothetical protein
MSRGATMVGAEREIFELLALYVNNALTALHVNYQL